MLPCFWGIAPGATSAEQAWGLLLELGAEIYGEDDADPSTDQGTAAFVVGAATVGVNIVERDGVVQSIDLYAQSHENPFSLQTDWGVYSLSNVLTTYGEPTRAFLEAVVEEVDDPSTRRYGLWLYYDRLGFAIRYGGSATVVDDIVHICPGWAGPGGMGAVRMLLQAPGAATPVEALTGYSKEQLQYVWPLEYASGLTTEEFHALYMEGDGLECIEMPLARPE